MSQPEETTVLVVDDDLDVLHVCQRRLSRVGVRVLTAPNGIVALEHANRRCPDAVVLDVRMPGPMNGFSLAAALRRLPGWQRVPIVFVTGVPTRDIKERCESVGAECFIAKPFDMDVLFRLLQNLLGRDELAEAQLISSAKRRQPVSRGGPHSTELLSEFRSHAAPCVPPPSLS